MAVSTNIDEIRGADGKLPTFTFPGSYPLVYFDRESNALCADCANRPSSEFDLPVVAYGGHFEGDDIECDECGAQIESAYGPV